jgi:hypothetical protein
VRTSKPTFLLENLKEENSLGDLDVDERIILKLILKKPALNISTELRRTQDRLQCRYWTFKFG